MKLVNLKTLNRMSGIMLNTGVVIIGIGALNLSIPLVLTGLLVMNTSNSFLLFCNEKIRQREIAGLQNQCLLLSESLLEKEGFFLDGEQKKYIDHV